MTESARELQVLFADDGQKVRRHLLLGQHMWRDTSYATALAVRTRRRPIPEEIAGWVPVPKGEAGFTRDSVVTLALTTLAPTVLKHASPAVLPAVYTADVVDSIRMLLALPPRKDSHGPTFFQYLPPPPFRAGRHVTLGKLFSFLKQTGWTPLRAGRVYRDHGWHPCFNSHDQFFAVVSCNDFHDRFPFPLTWIVPVQLMLAKEVAREDLALETSPNAFPKDRMLVAFPERIHSVEASQGWFLPCDDCRGRVGDFQSWRIPDPASPVQRNCVRCDGVQARWPETVGTISGRSLAAVRFAAAKYLGAE